MEYKIICDSSSDLEPSYLEKEYKEKEIGFDVVPFIVSLDDKQIIDNGSITSEQFLDDLKKASVTSTSCPSPFSYEEKCDAHHNIIITISKKLSGSFNSAYTCGIDHENDVFIVDSKGTGGVEQLLVDKAYELIKENLSFEEIKTKLLAYRDELELYFSLSSFDNLVKKGRIKAGLAEVIKFLRVSLLCRAIDGEISLFKKCINYRFSISHIAQAIKSRKETHKRCVITYTDNLDDAIVMKDKIEHLDLFESITIVKAKVLNSFYALRKGLIVSF